MTRINTNIPSLIGLNNLEASNRLVQQSLTRIATGRAINRGADDPAGLIAATEMSRELEALRAEERALERNRTIADTADAALSQVSGSLSEMNALAVANANTGALSDAERAANQLQFTSLQRSVERTTRAAEFNGTPLLDGGLSIPAGRGGGALDVTEVDPRELGATEIDGETLSLRDTDPGASLAVTGDRLGETQAVLGAAADSVNTLRGTLGAFSRNTIGSRLNGIAAETANVSEARSLILDADLARETANLARAEVLRTGATAGLQLGNASAGRVFDLLS